MMKILISFVAVHELPTKSSVAYYFTFEDSLYLVHFFITETKDITMSDSFSNAAECSRAQACMHRLYATYCI